MGGSSSPMHGEGSQGPPNLVGREGMPSPARRPQRPRIKFTPEEDELLIELKEQKNLTWNRLPTSSLAAIQAHYK